MTQIWVKLLLDGLVIHETIFGCNLTPPIPDDTNVCQDKSSTVSSFAWSWHKCVSSGIGGVKFFDSNLCHQELEGSSFGYNFFGQMVAPCAQPFITAISGAKRLFLSWMNSPPPQSRVHATQENPSWRALSKNHSRGLLAAGQRAVRRRCVCPHGAAGEHRRRVVEAARGPPPVQVSARYGNDNIEIGIFYDFMRFVKCMTAKK